MLIPVFILTFYLAIMSHSWPSIFDGVLDAPDALSVYFNNTYLTQTTFYRFSAGWRTCLDPEGLLNPYREPFWKCVFYPNITNAFRLGLLSESNNTYLVLNNVDKSLATAADVTATVSTCLAAFCETLEDCKNKSLNPCSVTALNINGSMLNTDVVDMCVQSICASQPEPKANADIAGIGIIASYIIQTSMVLLSALILVVLVRLLENTNPSTSLISNDLDRERAELRSENLDQTPHDVHESDSRSTSDKSSGIRRFVDALIRALEEFLKAQCFLSISISIAALIALNSQKSLGMVDQLALVKSGGAGILPTTFNFYILASFQPGQKSWYLYILCLSTWISGFSVVFSPQMVLLNKLKTQTGKLDYGYQYPNACGNASPNNICPSSFLSSMKTEYTFYYTLCLPIMFGLTIWQFSSLPLLSYQPIQRMKG